ncbi:MAG: T9SS type A sorting domain-containing protein, partial [Rhodothermales bacterium]|nr:T9SS type A sorting domain-containing protein [Rhodothermales bacterium]
AQDISFAASAGGSLGDSGNGVAVDASGDMYVVGHFEVAAVFAEGQPQEVTIESEGPFDLFVAKYSQTGALNWVIRDGGGGVEQAFGVAIDSDGFIVVGGLFADSSVFGRGQTNETLLVESPNADHNGFVARYSPAGSLEWVKWAGNNQAREVAVDPSNNVYVTGFYADSATFGAGEPNEMTLLGDETSNDGFLAKFSSTGSFRWATAISGPGFDAAHSLSTDALGNIYVAGHFEEGAIIGAGDQTETTLSSDGETDGFVAQYDSAGVLNWVRTFGGLEADAVYSIASNSEGMVAIAGSFRGTAIFGEGDPNEKMLVSAGLADLFVASLQSDGEFLWTTGSGGTGDDLAFGVDISPASVVVSTGGFEGSATFGAGESGETILTSSGTNDIYVSKHDSSGSLLWAKRNGSLSSREFGEFGLDIEIDNVDNIVGVGLFEGAATFGSGEPGQTLLTSSGDSDAFLLKYGDAVPTSIEEGDEVLRPSLEVAGYPNPFVDKTVIRYFLPIGSNVRVSVYDALGRLIEVLSNRYEKAGWQQTALDASNLPAGLFLGRVESHGLAETVVLFHVGS